MEKVEPLLPLIERVIVQARTRVLEGKQVAASDKVLSLFEPHTRIIPRHKGGRLLSLVGKSNSTRWKEGL